MQSFSDFDYCNSLKLLLGTQKIVGRTGKRFDRLSALSTKKNLIALHTLMLELKPKSTLEIGLSFGGSCLALAATHRELQHYPSKQHIAIDPFQKTVWDDVARLLLKQENLLDYVEIYENFSFNVLPELLQKGQKFDLIYIDGSHLFEDVFIDLFYSNKLLNQKGLLVFDDSSDPHVRKALKFIESNFRETYKRLDLSYLRSGFDKLKYSIAILAGKRQLTAYHKIGNTDRDWNSRFYDF